MVETYRELASSMMEVYLSSMSNRMNENIRFLTLLKSNYLCASSFRLQSQQVMEPDAASPRNFVNVLRLWADNNLF